MDAPELAWLFRYVALEDRAGLEVGSVSGLLAFRPFRPGTQEVSSVLPELWD